MKENKQTHIAAVKESAWPLHFICVPLITPPRIDPRVRRSASRHTKTRRSPLRPLNGLQHTQATGVSYITLPSQDFWPLQPLLEANHCFLLNSCSGLTTEGRGERGGGFGVSRRPDRSKPRPWSWERTQTTEPMAQDLGALMGLQSL